MNRYKYLDDYIKPHRPDFFVGQKWEILARLKANGLALTLMKPVIKNLSGVMTPGWDYVNHGDIQRGATGWIASSVLEANYEQV